MFDRVVNMLEIVNITGYMAVVLNMPGSCIYYGSEYSRVLNIPGFRICQGSEYARVLNIPGF